MIGNRFLRTLIGVVIAFSVPVALTLIGARLMMTPAYLSFEYRRADFPLDDYGFTLEDRLNYGPAALNYMVYDQPISALADLTFSDGTPFYNDRELGHMVDVQRVARAAFIFLIGLLIAQALVYAALWRRNRAIAISGIINGGLLTLMLLAGLTFAVIVAWDYFFDQFHELFFSAGTWQFAFSDSLIRLYPVRFWQDTAINIGIFAGVGALFLIAVGVSINRRSRG